ncbi:hypothetical protein [Wolbachia endosymbiont of Nomada leucophthalma]|uniref:hypothetical protein n=1 Tax=Wolbachia endosymbiont of Nomada leucophthalma TaxID=1854758 RepID=UPI001C54D939|nr:hypothetical protein [Wolbachia endosymbiont of Nomada leucophthalma]
MPPSCGDSSDSISFNKTGVCVISKNLSTVGVDILLYSTLLFTSILFMYIDFLAKIWYLIGIYEQ